MTRIETKKSRSSQFHRRRFPLLSLDEKERLRTPARLVWPHRCDVFCSWSFTIAELVLGGYQRVYGSRPDLVFDHCRFHCLLVLCVSASVFEHLIHSDRARELGRRELHFLDLQIAAVGFAVNCAAAPGP
jgi:hypothetical protein